MESVTGSVTTYLFATFDGLIFEMPRGWITSAFVMTLLYV
jgi:hypothetical protein